MELKDSFEELLTGAGISFIGVVFAQILTLGSEVLFARSLGPLLYGQIGLAASIATSLAIILSLGLPQGIARLWRTVDEENQRQSLFFSSYTIVALLGLLTIGVFFQSSEHISILVNSPELSQILPYFSIYAVTFALSLVSIGALRGMKEPALSVVSRDVLPKTIGLVAFLLLSIVGRPYLGAVTFWVSVGISSMITSGVLLFKQSQWKVKSIVNSGFSELNNLWHFSWPLAIESAITTLMINIDILLIGYYMSSSAVGLYRSVQPLSRGLVLFLGSFTFLYLPIATDYFNSGKSNELKQIYQSSTKWILLVTYPLALLFVFFPDVIVLTLFGDEYLPATTTLSVLSLGMFLRAVVGPNGTTIKAIDRTKIDLLASVLGITANIILNIILVPRFGLIGAAIGTSLGFLVFNLVDSIVVYASTGVHPLSFGVFKQLLPSGVIAWYISTTNVVKPTFQGLILGGLGLGIIHIFSYLITKSVDSDDVLIIESVEEKTNINLSMIKRLI